MYSYNYNAGIKTGRRIITDILFCHLLIWIIVWFVAGSEYEIESAK